MIFFLSVTEAITTIHHDKPENAKISKMATQMKQQIKHLPININLTKSERQKRLLPYANFYLTENINLPQQQQLINRKQKPIQQYHNNNNNNKYIDGGEILHQPQTKFTPFLDSNAIPGPFLPIANPNQGNNEEKPNFSQIYDKLSQLKLNQIQRPIYYQQQNKPIYQYQQLNNNKPTIQPTKTFIETYTATNIDIPNGNVGNRQENYQQPQYINEQPYHIKQILRKPFIIIQAKPKQPPPIIVIQRKPIGIKPQPVAIVDEKFVAEKVKYSPPVQQQQQVIYEPETVYVTPKQQENIIYTSTEPPTLQENYIPSSYIHTQPITQPTILNTNPLSEILKQLQSTNTLPTTLTPENIDNSIKTLVKILTVLKKQQKFSKTKPIVVAEEQPTTQPLHHEQIYENEADVTHFPGDGPDGGTPGTPGVDYPALSTIPPTRFNCKTQRYKGFFGDPDTNCQVWHYCDLNGGQASFLCPNGTIFSQVALTCDWWYNVKCASTPQLYVLNERLYKYILPLAPKFPEDYSGPLVDK